MSLYYRKNVKPFLALFFSLSVLFSGIVINSIHAQSGDSTAKYLVTAVILMSIHLVLYSLINYIKPKRFPIFFLIFGFIIIVSIIIASFVIDSRFLKSAFHSAGQIFIISLYRKKDIYKEDSSKNVTRSLIFIAFFVIFSSIFWVLLLGYFIVIRNMPGGHQFMLFNLYTAVNILVAVDAIIVLMNSLNTHVFINRNSIKINNTDYSNLLSPGEMEILSLFAETDERQLNCSQILINRVAGSSEFSKREKKCIECLENKYKATLCSDYKHIYNQINKLKKFLETMNVATILPPANKMDIITVGWKLRMFENTRLHLQK